MADAPQFDRKQYSEEIRRKLEGFDPHACVAFAARCAWRAAPWLLEGWRDRESRNTWLRKHGVAITAALSITLFRAKGQITSSGAALGTDALADALTDITSLGIEGPCSAAAEAAYIAAAVAFEVSYAITAEVASVACQCVSSDAEALKAMFLAVGADLEALSSGFEPQRMLHRKLWLAEPSSLHRLLKQWSEVLPNISQAETFFLILQSIHYHEPKWELLQSGVDAWWGSHPLNREGQLDEKSSSSKKKSAKAPRPQSTSAAEETSSPEIPPEPKLRRIIQPRLVSTTSVTTDGEAEKLTPTARNCMLALREFLVSDETLPPLTVAVEAPWGGGKSSLMRHLQDALTNDSDATTKQRPYKEEPIPTVWFNPWKHEAGKTLWAAFAVAFERQLAGRLIWPWRVCVRRGLAFRRLTFGDWFMLAARLLVWLGVGWVLYWLWQHPDLVKPSGEKDAPKADVVMLLLQGAPWIGFPLLLWQLISTWNKEFGSPLKLDVSRLLTHNDHTDKVDDLHRFHEDFRRLMRAYIPKRKNGKPGKAVVFIDDLDRCEAPKAAELLQSLHQMLNVQERSRTDADKNAPGVICVLGMDREKVAAAVAAKHEKLLPLLKETDANGKVSRANAMIFGHEFLEKFIQLTLHLPAMQGNDLEEYLTSITGAKKVERATNTKQKPSDDSAKSATPDRISITSSAGKLPSVASDPLIAAAIERREQAAAAERIEQVSEDLGDGSLALECASYVTEALENNPRKLKQFVNLFRLRLYLAAAMNFLDLPDREDGKPEEDPLRPMPVGRLSVHHLAKLVALELAAPSEMTDIREKPSSKLFDALQSAFPADTKPALDALVSYRDPVQPEAYDLEKAALEVYFHYFKPEAPTASAVAA